MIEVSHNLLVQPTHPGQQTCPQKTSQGEDLGHDWIIQVKHPQYGPAINGERIRLNSS